MIYNYSKLTEIEYRSLRNIEPYMDFGFDVEKHILNWTVHRRVKNGKEYEKIRLYRFEQLRQGLICTDITEAKELMYYLAGKNYSDNLDGRYPWLEDYRNIQKKKIVLALPLEEFIRSYAGDFEMLALVDFKEAFEMRARIDK